MLTGEIEKHRQVLESTVKRHARFQPANGLIETHSVCDRDAGEYMIIDSGWNEKRRRIYDVRPAFPPAKRHGSRRTRQHRRRSRQRIIGSRR